MHEYDLAVSFAGAQRTYVEEFVRECQRLRLKVLYDRDLAVDLWGKNFIFEFRKIYGGTRPRFVVTFISKEFLEAPYPMDELAAAVEQELHRGGGYVLPVIVGDVTVPPALLNPAVGFLRADDYTAAELAGKMALRARSSPPAPSVTPLPADRP